MQKKTFPRHISQRRRGSEGARTPLTLATHSACADNRLFALHVTLKYQINEGRVLAVGPGRRKGDGELIPVGTFILDWSFSRPFRTLLFK